ncbi:hypothetical protein AB852_03935 [Streptomyces uncialis]|uniref:Uncharacterized protein n=1 Tax=Streptomyces uncialis TaxID=1048205 RepID=A0A1Q4VFU8_9ACTN|nr:hypothetical protein AB852_03935 [Streptomyces uncialis]
MPAQEGHHGAQQGHWGDPGAQQLPPAVPAPPAGQGWGGPPGPPAPPQQPATGSYGAQNGYGYPPPPPQGRGAHRAPSAGPLPPVGGPDPDAEATRMIPPVPAGPAHGTHAAFPPAAGGDAPATQYLPPIPPGPSGAHAGPPSVAESPTELIPPIGAAPLDGPDAQATQLIPPVPPAPGRAPAPPAPGRPGAHAAHGSDAEATRIIPPVPATPGPLPDHDGATQVIPPVLPGALPPEIPGPARPGPAPRGQAPAAPGPASPAVDQTHYLGTVPRAGGGAAPDVHSAPTQHLPQVPPTPTSAPYGIRPGAPGERPPPSEFDALFRSDEQNAAQAPPPAPGPRPAPAHHAPGMAHMAGPPRAAGPHQGRAANRRDARSGRGGDSGRKNKKVPLFAALGVGLVVVGVGAGTLLGGGDEKKDKGSAPVSATEPVPEESAPEETGPSPSDSPKDTARQQAEGLDKLLADSGGSRATVISAVADIGRCKNLDDAGDDLRDAADQRRGLVTRLAELPIGELPQHARLGSALNTAWEASAKADEHYADWAARVDSDRGCRKGKARQTKEAGAGNRASGEATKAKREASALWNTIAKKYSLTPRQPTQL